MKKVLSFVAGTALLMAMCGMSAFADERTYLDPSTPEKVTIAEAKGDQEVVFANGTPITIVERTDGEEGALPAPNTKTSCSSRTGGCTRAGRKAPILPIRGRMSTRGRP